jgi:RNA-directed DNA polymerase
MSLRDRLSAELPFSTTELTLLIHSAPFAYKSYKIRKASGGWRDVSQPTPAVKLLQRFLITREFNDLPLHTAATAYRNKIGLAENVKPHLAHRFLLKMDFKEFFPSLRPADFRFLISKDQARLREYSEQDLRDLVRILFKATPNEENLRLAIGAPSSPHISNVLLYELDTAIQALCDNRGIAYTRYADDLSFSTSEPGLLKDHEAAITELVSSHRWPKLMLNEAKTVHTSIKRGRRITGLVINNDGEISVGRERMRKLRAEIHAYAQKKLNEEETKTLKGYVSFLNSVQPGSIDNLRKRYGRELIDGLLYRRVFEKAA